MVPRRQLADPLLDARLGATTLFFSEQAAAMEKRRLMRPDVNTVKPSQLAQ